MVTQKNPGVNDYKSYVIDFALTTYCQAKCRTCARTNENTGEKEDWLELKHMNLDVFRRTLESPTETRISAIQFCGEFGDPMMHPQVDKFIETALEFTNRVLINTNGGLRNADWYTEIGNKYGNRLLIVFSIDGVDHETNWKYREGVNFTKAWENMIAYGNTSADMRWDFILFEWNWHQIPLASKLAKENDIELRFKFNNRWFGLITQESKIEADKLLQEFDHE